MGAGVVVCAETAAESAATATYVKDFILGMHKDDAVIKMEFVQRVYLQDEKYGVTHYKTGNPHLSTPPGGGVLYNFQRLCSVRNALSERLVRPTDGLSNHRAGLLLQYASADAALMWSGKA